ncbi:MAG: hypothetical protein KVP17_004662 [Porospora cf. gigantea B]|uniref:uncharacterized protein n=1 Tax=Porospora cf. gigantea B TaxID=2853592 RepID=UPI003571A0CA|nr:MAG: hypothetical protein KVP17_004662 [Porospora cf. gigantea B]
MLRLLLPLVCCAQLTTQFSQLLGAHNTERGKYRIGLLQWDNALAKKAQQHANKCSYEHSSTSFRTYNSIDCSNCHHGENLAMRGDCPTDMNAWVDMWVGEDRYYDCERGEKSPWGETGHWTQVVWSRTSYLGCAVNCSCGGKYKSYLVCHYSKAGNMNGVRPFPKENCKYSDVPPPHTWMSSGQKAVTISSLVFSVALILVLSFVFFVLK